MYPSHAYQRHRCRALPAGDTNEQGNMAANFVAEQTASWIPSYHNPHSWYWPQGPSPYYEYGQVQQELQFQSRDHTHMVTMVTIDIHHLQVPITSSCFRIPMPTNIDMVGICNMVAAVALPMTITWGWGQRCYISWQTFPMVLEVCNTKLYTLKYIVLFMKLLIIMSFVVLDCWLLIAKLFKS